MSRDTHLPRRHDITFDRVVQTIPGSTTLFMAEQMDDLHWFWISHYKRVAGVQKLSEVVHGPEARF
jgi:hypothetical protein